MLNVVAATKVGDNLDRILKTVHPKVLAGRLRALADIDVSRHLDQIAVPCLYLSATKDRLIPRTALQPFKLQAHCWTIRELHGPHLLLQTTPIEAAKVIREFVAGLACG